jgi:ribonucleoside-diphosphate reductase alpha chain
MPSFRSNENPMFRSKFSEDIFKHKYAHYGCETWDALASVLVEDVCQERLSTEDKDQLTRYVNDLKFIPGGRYLYYAGRLNKFFNNCYLLRAEEDTREDWANLPNQSLTVPLLLQDQLVFLLVLAQVLNLSLPLHTSVVT